MTTTQKPPTLGRQIDKLWRLNERYKALQTKAKLIAREIEEFEDRLLLDFGNAALEGAQGRFARVTVQRKTFPQLKDAPAFFAFVFKNKAWDLLYKRVNPLAWRERQDEGVEVPGTMGFTKISLSMRSIIQEEKLSA